MNIMKISQYKYNNASSISFRSKEGIENNSSDKKKSKESKIALALVGLAAITTAGILISRRKSADKIVSGSENKPELWQELKKKYSDLLEKYKNTSKEDREIIKILSDSDKFFEQQSKDNLLLLTSLFEAEKKDPKTIVPPLILNFSMQLKPRF